MKNLVKSAEIQLKKLVKRFSPVKVSPIIVKKNERDLIFIHINKNGGTSIAKSLGVIKKHMTVKEIIDKIGIHRFNNAYKFTVVRNPWDRAVSLYKFRKKTNQTGLANANIDFKEWIHLTLGPTQSKVYYDKPRMFQPQVQWLMDSSGQLKIDAVLRFEFLSEDFNKLQETFPEIEKLQHLNSTKKSNYKSYYDNATKKLVADWYRHDIEQFKYEF